MDSNTPNYYKNENGKDLYDIFLEEYGADVLLQHMEMEVRQYVKRLRVKGQYASDLEKISNITRRMLLILQGQWMAEQQAYSDQLTFDFNFPYHTPMDKVTGK